VIVWLIGFPLTSRPVSLGPALPHGAGFTVQAAIGTLGGEACVCVFCLAYCLAAVFVFSLTAASALLGPQLSGLLSPFPVFGLLLAVFAHRLQGPAAASAMLRGNLIGALAFAAFFLVVGAGLPHVPILWTYLLAGLAARIVNGILLRMAR
jgi:hypothetical protein